jgi:hypothetical protein
VLISVAGIARGARCSLLVYSLPELLAASYQSTTLPYCYICSGLMLVYMRAVLAGISSSRRARASVRRGAAHRGRRGVGVPGARLFYSYKSTCLLVQKYKY